MRCALLLLLALPGCAANFDETTFVKIGRPADVAVGVQTPRGGEWLLERDSGVKTVEVPDSNPPLTEGDKFAQLKREPFGNVDLSCPSCKGARAASPVPLDGEIALRGELDKTITWTPDELAMHYRHIASFPCYRTPRHDCPREAIALWLETPRENVEEIRHVKLVQKSYGEMTGAKIGLGSGIAADAVGLGLLGLFAFDKDARQLPTLGVASTFLAVGTFFIASAIRTLTAEDSDTVVYRAPAKSAQ